MLPYPTTCQRFNPGSLTDSRYLQMSAWKSTVWWSSGVLAVSILLSAVCWKWFGNDYHLFESLLLDINFFATICNFFSVIGLGLAVFQVSTLRREEQVKRALLHEMQASEARTASLIKCGNVRALLELLSGRVETQENVSAQQVLEYVCVVNECIHIMRFVSGMRENITGAAVPDVSLTLSLLEELLTELELVNESRHFSKQAYLLRIRQILLEIERCEQLLKHD